MRSGYQREGGKLSISPQAFVAVKSIVQFFQVPAGNSYFLTPFQSSYEVS